MEYPPELAEDGAVVPVTDGQNVAHHGVPLPSAAMVSMGADTQLEMTQDEASKLWVTMGYLSFISHHANEHAQV